MPAPVGITVKFSKADFEAAWAVGESRHRHHCERRGRRVTKKGLDQEGLGAVGEAAVARLFSGQWDTDVGRSHYGSDDVITACGDALEVKTTDWPNGKMLVYHNIPDDRPIVLAIADPPARTIRVVGWLPAGEGKKDAWWMSEWVIPCFAVPQKNLRPLEELPCYSRLLQSASPQKPSSSSV